MLLREAVPPRLGVDGPPHRSDHTLLPACVWPHNAPLCDLQERAGLFLGSLDAFLAGAIVPEMEATARRRPSMTMKEAGGAEGATDAPGTGPVAGPAEDGGDAKAAQAVAKAAAEGPAPLSGKARLLREVQEFLTRKGQVSAAAALHAGGVVCVRGGGCTGRSSNEETEAGEGCTCLAVLPLPHPRSHLPPRLLLPFPTPRLRSRSW